MHISADLKQSWKSAIVPSIAIVVLSMTPQIHFWSVRGSDWQGAYAGLFGDEFLYSTYINALIDGRPRRTDPFAGRDDHKDAPMPESLFSIQFVPSYILAYLARLFGMSASGIFILLAPLAGLLSSASIFWLLHSGTTNRKFVATGVLGVLCLGASVGAQGLIGLFTRSEVAFLGLPFLRRYEPALPFPLFFVFCTLVWKALTSERRISSTLAAVFAGLVLVLLVFSYFYLWTAAVAWFVGITLLWTIFRAQEWTTVMRTFLIVGSLLGVALIFYFRLIVQVPATLSDAQVLLVTHKPDLTRPPEIIGALILIAVVVLARRRNHRLSDRRLLLISSLSILPFLVFNQQIVTGRSIQPYHYEIFIANYTVLVALILTVSFFYPGLPRRHIVLTGILCLIWGALEMNVMFFARIEIDPLNDKLVPVLKSLNLRAHYDGTWEGLRKKGTSGNSVFSPDTGVSRLLPTWAAQPPFLTIGSKSFQSLGDEERKENLFTHLYFCGATPERLRDLLSGRGDDGFLGRYALTTLFGSERVISLLGSQPEPITSTEIEEKVGEFERFLAGFSQKQALKYPITYVIVSEKSKFDFSRLSLWYDRRSLERIGEYDLYYVSLRQE